jgi:hypothetical protein
MNIFTEAQNAINSFLRVPKGKDEANVQNRNLLGFTPVCNNINLLAFTWL